MLHKAFKAFKTSVFEAALARLKDEGEKWEKEVAAASRAIEEKTARVGEVAVEIVENENDHESTSENLAEDEKSLADIQKTCAAKTKEFEALMKTNQMELSALADTIKLLNDDDALEHSADNLLRAPANGRATSQTKPS